MTTAGDFGDRTGSRPAGRDAIPVLVRLPREQANRIDEWREKQASRCSRPEAIRRLVEIGAHCEPYVERLLQHLEHAAEAEFREINETVAALRRALGEAEMQIGDLGDCGSEGDVR
jgi:hypothetical protein